MFNFESSLFSPRSCKERCFVVFQTGTEVTCCCDWNCKHLNTVVIVKMVASMLWMFILKHQYKFPGFCFIVRTKFICTALVPLNFPRNFDLVSKWLYISFAAHWNVWKLFGCPYFNTISVYPLLSWKDCLKIYFKGLKLCNTANKISKINWKYWPQVVCGSSSQLMLISTYITWIIAMI